MSIKLRKFHKSLEQIIGERVQDHMEKNNFVQILVFIHIFVVDSIVSGHFRTVCLG